MATWGQDPSERLGRFRRSEPPAEPDAPPPKPRFKHDVPIRAAGLSCDRKVLVALDAQGFINGWDAVTAKRLYRLPLLDPKEVQQRLTFSPDGRFVALSPWSMPAGFVRVLDPRTGKELRRFDRGFSPSFSPDTELLACTDGPQLRRWALKNGAELPRFPECEHALKWSAWSPVGDLIATSSEDFPIVQVWEMPTNRRRAPLVGKELDEAPTGLAFSPDGKMLAIGGHWGIRFESLEGPPEREYHSHEEYALGSLKFLADGRRMVALTRRRRLLVWELFTGKPLFTWASYELEDGSIDLSEGGNSAIWIERGGMRLERIPELLGGYDDGHVIRSLCFTPSGHVVTGDDQGSIRVWDPATQKEIRRHAVPLHRIRYFSRDGAWAVFGGARDPVGLWDLQAGREILKVHATPSVQSIALSPDSGKLALGHTDGSITIWSIPDRKEVSRIRSDMADVTAISWSSDGRSLAWGDRLGVVVIAEGEQGREPVRFRTRGGFAIQDLSFSPDGRMVVARDELGLHRAYSDPGIEPTIVDGWAPVVPYPRRPDHRWNASGCYQKRGQLGIIADAVSPDGSYFAGITRAGKLVIWEAPGAK